MVVFGELLPGSSSSTHDHNHHIYDVFLSFRGADTRNGFTDHLYNALLDAGFITFLDEEKIETGEPLKPELESAIRSSRASIIVLSKNYASSTWCLEELVLILDRNRNFNQIIIPIFYDVEPTDVRKQQSSFGEATAKHKQRLETETDAKKRSELAQKMESWKLALTEVANLKGKNANGRKETELINEVVTDIHRRLGVLLSNNLPLLVGVGRHIKSISSWLTDESCPTTHILTIVGMGGIGKTSLARYVFGLHSSKFHKSSFIEGVNTRCKENFNGLLELQKQLHGNISKKIPLHANDVSVYTSKIENVLARKKVFIVLDDIGSLKQLDALLGQKHLHSESKVLITTKDASLTERCGLFDSQVQPKLTKVLLDGLCEIDSLELLCIHAFKSQKPKEGYKEVSQKLAKYCDGHPLALEVLGRSLHKRDVVYWEEYIKRLKKEPYSNINNTLKMSFDTLPFESDKELFKHIACFFVGINRDLTETVLNACDINTSSGITNLVDRCLLSIRWNNELMMHQLVQEMGRYLVRQESPNKPRERSRLWCHEDSFKVLENKEGTDNIIVLAIDMRMLEKEKLNGSLELKTDALIKMDSLTLLHLNYVKISGSYKNISKQLRWLCMHGFHSDSMPTDLPMENLVALDMSHSNIKSFGMVSSITLTGSCSDNKKLLGSLKILDLGFCEQLCSLGGFGELPALEMLIVRNCISLIEVCESVEQCDDLVHFDLSYCYKLKMVPTSIGKLKKVKTLLLDGCNPFPSQINKGDTKSLYFRINSQNTSCVIPSDLKFFTISLPRSLVRLSLANNNLSNESFSMDFSYLSMLEYLSLNNNPIVSMPSCVRTLPRLQRLYMDECKMLTSVEHPPCTLRILVVHVYSNNLPSKRGHNNFLRKVKFDTDMSPLFLAGVEELPGSPFEIDGMVKIEALADVEEKILHSLGWTNLEFIKEGRLEAFTNSESTECQTQMYYEFGIFSTIYKGWRMPDWISQKSNGSSISFTIPSSPKKLQRLNSCCVETTNSSFTIPSSYYYFELPIIRISNITTNHTWIYEHYIEYAKSHKSDCLSFLSHWMFGENEMKDGDHITITIEQRCGVQCTKECGISVVYDEDGKNEEEEDVLGYYKSWNHIIGGDLSFFQSTTGEYFLNKTRFYRSLPHYNILGTASIDNDAIHKGR
ncbi:hypothetical protein SSX86_029947 [Deinandra increscens subsp. villosa]|uniref:TIR domain-containing protein n=1 Tax=Deinandra increscens subsp. villosa TaxID=3103831 RepID=A0AAP0CAK6_9ASTR